MEYECPICSKNVHSFTNNMYNYVKLKCNNCKQFDSDFNKDTNQFNFEGKKYRLIADEKGGQIYCPDKNDGSFELVLDPQPLTKDTLKNAKRMIKLKAFF